MTFSNKFSALDNREAAFLDDMDAENRVVFEKICAGYEAEFRPESHLERDTVYCLATLRWGIDRTRAAEQATRDLFAAHGYMPPKIKIAVDDFAAYQRELQIRYEYYFSQYHRLLSFRPAA
jgi:hypothetical protein